MDQKVTSRKWILTIFKCKNEVPKQVRLEKHDKKCGHSLVFISPPWYMMLKLAKIASFLQCFADISKKYKYAIVIYVYASESSCLSLLEDDVGYYAMI